MGKVLTRRHLLPGISHESHVPLRPRDLALYALREPSTPAEFLVQALHARKGHCTGGSGAPGANIKIRLELYEEHVQGTSDGIFQDPMTFTLMLKVDAPLATHGILNTPLDSYVGLDRDAPDAPLWLQDVHASWLHPRRFKCTLGWLRSFVDGVLQDTPPEAQADPTLTPWFRIQAHLREVVDILACVPHVVALGPRPQPRPLHRKAGGHGPAAAQVTQLTLQMHQLHV